MDLTMQIPNSVYLKDRYSIKTNNLSYTLSSTKYDHLICDESQETANKQTKYILKDVNCEAKPGEITAIAGASGAGKTTLLDILAGVIPLQKVFGQVLVNDQPLNATLFRKLSGYVTQDDALFPMLTIEETFMYSARLRVHGGCARATERVRTMLKELGLEHISGERIGSVAHREISGGEKRRVSIGAELVHDPGVVFIDEPTSGLDSTSALQLMFLLKSMAANHQKTIVVSIHQPGYRILELIDTVILLSDGSVLHNGPLYMLEERLESLGHCISHGANVLEYAISVSKSLHVKESDNIICTATQATNLITTHSISINDEETRISYCNSMFKETWILAERFSKNIFRTRHLFAAKTIQALLAGIILGTIFQNIFHDSKKSTMQSQLGFFSFSLACHLSCSTETLSIFLQERRILMRETSRGTYRISSYIIANTMVFLPFLLIVTFLFTIPVYMLAGLEREIDRFLYFSLVTWMVALMSNSFAACFSALVTDHVSGMTLITTIMGSFFLFSGYFIAKKDIQVYWRFMHYMSLFKYPFESYLINEYGGTNGRSKCVESSEGVCLLTGDTLLANLGIEESHKWSNLVIMLSFISGYRIVCFLILWFRSNRTRG